MERDPCLWQFRGHLQLQEGAGTLLPPQPQSLAGTPHFSSPCFSTSKMPIYTPHCS